MIVEYPVDVERAMQFLFQSLGERDRRIYAAVETLKLGHGGVRYIAQLLGCGRKTIWRGFQELDQPTPIPSGRSRKKGVAARHA